MQYDFKEIEKKWQSYWIDNKCYKVKNDITKPKCYVLDMFPYPSGAGLHVGHPLGYIASDIYARYKRLKGFNVLHPMGFDAFGLPAEQYAIETGQHPATTTEVNIERYKNQLGKIGFCFDWSREVKTSEPSYYKWTQWIFLQLFNSWYNTKSNQVEHIDSLKQSEIGAKMSESELMEYRLAYKKESYVNWCEVLGTVLANDEVVNGVSERGGHPVERKLMSQWFLRITAFAERLLQGLEQVDFPESLKEMQRNWIGKSEGAEIRFELKSYHENASNQTLADGDIEHAIKVFTTRPDTIFGVSFIVLAPEHELVSKITSPEQQAPIDKYIHLTNSKSERDRLAETKQISGCFTGAFAIHPLTKQEIPIWIADYVLSGYGTGAIMAVPCGDERDYAFAKHFDLAIPNIFKNIDLSEKACSDKNVIITNSDFISELTSKEASQKMIDKVEELKIGTRKINYRMRDAGFSRQRYWGEPFPIVYNDDGDAIAMRDTDLPLELPFLQTYSAGPQGKGPLANATDWVNTSHGVRETDTMPGYAGSSWYYLRYMDPSNTSTFCDKSISDYWNQVDVYVGGAEHAVGHLLYSRMWCKALHDLGYISFDEPYKKLINQGMIQGNSRLVYRKKGTNTFVSAGLKNDYEVDTLYTEYAFCDGLELDIEKFKNWKAEYKSATFELEDGKYICGSLVEKMSKRLFNVVNPDDIIDEYGADTFRMYEMFLGPLEMSKPWDTKGIEGVHRFIKKLWKLYFDEQGNMIVNKETPSNEELKVLHQTIKKIESDTENFTLNTSISQFMICVNELNRLQCNKQDILEPLSILLSPFAPHISEELWHVLGKTTSILEASFPIFDANYLKEDSFNYPIAIQGKARTEIKFSLDMQQDQIEPLVLENEIVIKWMEGKPLKKFVFVKGKMINVVV
jgi:leucyl-tRNA synthetase